MARAGHGDVPGLRVENDIKHADKHVLLDVGVELAVDAAEGLGGGAATGRGAAHHGAAHAGDEGGGDAFARDVGDDDAPAVLVNPEVVEVVAADVVRRDVEAADFVAGDVGRACGEEDALDIAGRLDVAVEALFLAGFEVDGLAEQGEGGLAGDGFEHGEVFGPERGRHRAVDHGEHAEDFVAVGEAGDEGGGGALAVAGEAGQSGVVEVEEVRSALLPDSGQGPLAGTDGLKAQEALHGNGVRGGLGLDVLGNADEGCAGAADVGWSEKLARTVHEVECTAVRVEDAGGTFDDEAVQFATSARSSESFAEAVEEIEDPLLFGLEFAPLASQPPQGAALEADSPRQVGGDQDEDDEQSRDHTPARGGRRLGPRVRVHQGRPCASGSW